MRDAGCHLDRDLTQHAVVGLVEVIPKLRQFFSFADEAEEIFAKAMSMRSCSSIFPVSIGMSPNELKSTEFPSTTTAHRNCGLGAGGVSRR